MITENKDTGKDSNKNFHIPAFIILSMIIFYDEIILKEGTMRGSFFPEIIFIGLASVFAGCLIVLLTSFSKKPKINRKTRQVIVIIITILFIVNYFVYRQFKIFYDINTVTAGAGGALGEFGSLIVRLIFNPVGFIHLVLFILPAVFYTFFYQKNDPAERIHVHSFSVLIITLVMSLIIDSCSIGLLPVYRSLVSAQYSYQTVVNDFGLLSGITLDIWHMISGPSSFAIESQTAAATQTPAPEASATPVIYEKNELDIDFSALASSSQGILSEMDQYVASLSATHKNEYTGLFKGKNLIMITAEAFSGKIIDPKLTPTLYRLATKGIQFTDYYQPASAGTTGGEYEIIFGAMPTSGGSSFKNMTNYNNYMTMGSQLNRLGYNGWAFHNNSYTFYDRNLTHNAIGYSNGFMGMGNGMEQYVSSQWPESDLEMIDGTFSLYSDDEPFNIYYMTVSGHNGYDYGSNAMTRKNWDRVQNLSYSDEVKGYIAAQLELEDALTSLLEMLEEKGIADDTVIVLSADHFPYGLDYGASPGNMPYLSELYGESVNDYLTRDQNTLIIWSGSLEDEDPIVVDTPVSSVDILPTLSNLFGTAFDSRLFIGRDVFSEATPLVFEMTYDWKTDLGTYIAATGTFTPNEGVTVPDGYVDRINTIVKNKMIYCQDYQAVDYFAHVFN